MPARRHIAEALSNSLQPNAQPGARFLLMFGDYRQLSPAQVGWSQSSRNATPSAKTCHLLTTQEPSHCRPTDIAVSTHKCTDLGPDAGQPSVSNAQLSAELPTSVSPFERPPLRPIIEFLPNCWGSHRALDRQPAPTLLAFRAQFMAALQTVDEPMHVIHLSPWLGDEWTCLDKVESFHPMKGELDEQAEGFYAGV